MVSQGIQKPHPIAIGLHALKIDFVIIIQKRQGQAESEQ